MGLDELGHKTETPVMSRDTCARLKQVFDALRELMTPPDPPMRPIGFILPEDKGSKRTAGARVKA